MSKPATPTELPTYSVPLELTDQHVAIVGKTGSGKTVTAKGYVEQLIGAGRRVVIYDPTGVWWGLRYRPDGSDGLKVAHVGGLYGDVPLTKEHGGAVGRFAGTYDGCLIVDTSELLIGEKHQFAKDFFRALYETNRKLLALVIDEADEVAPQNPFGDAKVTLHQVDRIVRRGRVRGFVVSLLTQRAAVLHKNVLSQAGTLIAMQLTASQDRDAVKAWIQGQADLETGKQVLAQLPKLTTGRGFIWSPGAGILELVRFPMAGTMDSSRAPKHDEPPPAPPAERSYVGEFPEVEAALVQSTPAAAPRKGRKSRKGGRTETDAAADPPMTAAAFAAQTRGFLDSQRHPEPDAAAALERDTAAARRAGYDQGYEDGFKAGYLVQASTLSAAVRGVVAKGEDFVLELREIGARLGANAADLATEYQAHIDALQRARPGDNYGRLARDFEGIPYRSAMERFGEAASDSAQATDLGMSDDAIMHVDAAARMEQAKTEPWMRPLNVLAHRHPARFTAKDWATLCGMKASGGAWGGHVRALRDRGYVEMIDGLYGATDAGLEAAGVVAQEPSSRRELIELWYEKLGGHTGRILNHLVAVHPNATHRNALAELCGMRPTGGAFQQQLRRLKQNNLVTVDGAYYRAGRVLVP